MGYFVIILASEEADSGAQAQDGMQRAICFGLSRLGGERLGMAEQVSDPAP